MVIKPDSESDDYQKLSDDFDKAMSKIRDDCECLVSWSLIPIMVSLMASVNGFSE